MFNLRQYIASTNLQALQKAFPKMELGSEFGYDLPLTKEVVYEINSLVDDVSFFRGAGRN